MDRMSEQDRRRAIVDTNLAYILADVAHSFAMSAEQRVNRYNLTMMRRTNGTGGNWRKVKQSARWLQSDITIHKQNCKALAGDMYHCPDETVDAACYDSDWLQDLIYLIIDRVGDNGDAMRRLHETIYNDFKSEFNIYDKDSTDNNRSLRT